MSILDQLAAAKAIAEEESAREAEAALHDAVKGLRAAQEGGGKLSKSALEQLYSAFKIAAAECGYDPRAKGTKPAISKEKFFQIAVIMVGECEPKILEKLWRTVDEDGSGFVDFGEFVQSAKLLTSEAASRAEEIRSDIRKEVETVFFLVAPEEDGVDGPKGFCPISICDRVIRHIGLDSDDFPEKEFFKCYVAAQEEEEKLPEICRIPRHIEKRRLEAVADGSASVILYFGINQTDVEQWSKECFFSIDMFISMVAPWQREIASSIPVLRQAFDVFDHDNSGDVDDNELAVMLRALGQNDSKEEVRAIMRMVDADDSGHMSFPEFVNFMGSRHTDESRRARLQANISALIDFFKCVETGGKADEDHDGKYVVDDLVSAMGLLGVTEKRFILEESFDRALIASGNSSGVGDLGTWVNQICEGRISKGLKNFMRRLRALREQFALFDDNGNGLISAAEVGSTLTSLFGWRPTNFESERIIGLVDQDESGKIDFSEFVVMMSHGSQSKSTEALDRIKEELTTLQALFTLFDVNDDAHLDFQIKQDHLGKVLRCLGREWEEEEIEEMMNEMGAKKDGGCGFIEFCDLMTGKSTPVQLKLKKHFQELQELFHLWDEDGSGEMTGVELIRILKLLGNAACPREEIGSMVNEADVDGDGTISFVEFVILISGQHTTTQEYVHKQLCDLREAFDLFDGDGDGEVETDEFVKMAAVFGMTDYEVHEGPHHPPPSTPPPL